MRQETTRRKKKVKSMDEQADRHAGKNTGHSNILYPKALATQRSPSRIDRQIGFGGGKELNDLQP